MNGPNNITSASWYNHAPEDFDPGPFPCQPMTDAEIAELDAWYLRNKAVSMTLAEYTERYGLGVQS